MLRSLLILIMAFPSLLYAQDKSAFLWELSYESRSPPIHLKNRYQVNVNSILVDQEKQIAGNGLGGTITKRIFSNFGIFYRTHFRYDHLYYDTDTLRSVAPEVRTWLSDHMIGASYSRTFGSTGNTLMIRLGLALMNNGSNFSVWERVDSAPGNWSGGSYSFLYSANYLEVKWAWSKIGLGLNVYHVERTSFPDPSPFLQLGLGLSYGVY